MFQHKFTLTLMGTEYTFWETLSKLNITIQYRIVLDLKGRRERWFLLLIIHNKQSFLALSIQRLRTSVCLPFDPVLFMKTYYLAAWVWQQFKQVLRYCFLFKAYLVISPKEYASLVKIWRKYYIYYCCFVYIDIEMLLCF